MTTQRKILTLTKAIQRLLHHAAKMHGMEDALAVIEEHLTPNEYEATEAFLRWLKDNDRSFGWNIPDVVADWEASQ